jgi:aldehyde dehydrogenase (NAD+)
MVPSEGQALAATDLYQVLDTSDLPGGVVNIVTGDKAKLGLELAKHDAVDAIWAFGGVEMATALETASTGNLKQTWCETVVRDWSDEAVSGGREILGHATQVKNIWVPWGE